MRWIAIVTTVALWCGAPTTASAQSSDGSASMMQQSMERYFAAERYGGYGFLSVGVGSLVGGGLMVNGSSDFYQGMSYPMFVLGGAQFIAGAFVIISSSRRITKFTREISDEPGDYKRRESARTQRTLTTMRILLTTEIIVALGGAGLAVWANSDDRDTLTGVGVGLSVQAVMLLAQDFLVKRRAKRYGRALQNFQVTMSPTTGSYGLSYQLVH